MELSSFLEEKARRYGAEALRGAMVFLGLDRELDQVIRHALGLGPYHPGQPSPWSHGVLLAEDYQGPGTRILDCGLRGPDGGVRWDAGLKECLDAMYGTAGGIHSGLVSDYDGGRLTAVGLKFLPALSGPQRRSLVRAAERLRGKGYRYDLPAMLRELVRRLARAALPEVSDPHRLSASGFLATVYREALHAAGDFAPNVPSADVSLDELWFSPLGAAATPDGVSALRPSAPAFATTAQPLEPVPQVAPPAAAAPPAVGLGEVATASDIQRLIEKLPSFQFIPDKETLQTVLEDALAQRQRVDRTSLGQPNATLNPSEFQLSLTQSSVPEQAPVASATFDLLGVGALETLDARWAETLWNNLFRTRVPFPDHRSKGLSDDAIVLELADTAAVAIAGDWGTGLSSSLTIGQLIAEQKPDHTVHLGDVYYSGTESEELRKLVEPWPAGTSNDKPCFTLNSNHEMYSGGHGYFNVALASPKFTAQQGLSYFGLTNARFALFGLDTAYHASRAGLYKEGVLDNLQLTWLARVGRDARAKGKTLVLLTHHQGLTEEGATTKLWDQVVEALEGGPDFWYWGHIHAGIEHTPRLGRSNVMVRGRCVGHGGVPYAPLAPNPSIVWTETERAGPAEARALNGFLMLRLTPTALDEEFIDERGRSRRRNTFKLRGTG